MDDLLGLDNLTLDNLQDLDKSLNLEEINFSNEIDVELIDSSKSEESKIINFIPDEIDLKELERLDDNLSSFDEDSSFSSDSSLDSISSDGSCIFAETFIEIRDFPVQVLAMERLETTLTELVKKELSLENGKVIYLRYVLVGGGAKQFGFIHNDLHSDNIMFKTTKIKEKYYQRIKINILRFKHMVGN